MRAPIYSREDADGTLRELFLPWWWPLFSAYLVLVLCLTGDRSDARTVDRMTVRYGRWRITPRDMR